MTQERTLFTFPMVAKHEPLTADPFYAWMDINVDRKNPGRFLDNLKAYLEPMGCDFEKHYIGEEAFATLNYVSETWCRLTPFFPPHSMSELFSDRTHPKYHVRGVKQWNDCSSGITSKLRQMVAESGWIYNVHPDNCYFEVRGDALHAVYQQILGSRFICRIKEA